MNKIKKIVFLLLAILVITFVLINIFVKLPTDYSSTHYALGRTDIEIYGLVKDKYIDKNNHNNPTIIIEDKSNNTYKCYFQTNDLVFYNNVNIGDSVMSKPQSREAVIINLSSRTTFDFINNIVKNTKNK